MANHHSRGHGFSNMPSHIDHPGHHNHSPARDHGRAFVIAIALNAGFVVVEFGYGFAANSTALMADAGHNLSDVLGLALAWGAAILSHKAPSERYTYGLRSTSILAALANAVLLLVACGAIAWEAFQRFSQPPLVAGLTVASVATAGLLINGLSAWLFLKGSKEDLNIRGAFLHMATDAAVSAGVLVSGVAILFTHWYWLDPVISLMVVTVIMFNTWGLLRDSVQLALSAVPPHIDIVAIEAFLRNQPGVTDVHDLHIWGLSTTESALTVHLVMPDGYPGDAFMDNIRNNLESHYAIHHSTLEIEQGTISHYCPVSTGSESIDLR
ncbi:cobalt-zinc-cadmium efflux system protein [Nitrosospira multiformis]|uniref:Cobalt-zinc-cadmium efflux system protein n=1 Tax=Nitrosospira multiformis TaxID=1231 RepID=A0A1I0FKY0_9PROT|nr:cation diffusion facilitator family transporter [Nitrosospira multiformis]SET58141.1 cobalt-zinc-cadmium efflux system protein [Nitrosospira multiformis]